MARQFVNLEAESTVRAAIDALGGSASYADVRNRLIEEGNGHLVRDILGLQMAGRINGIVRAQPDGSKPVLVLWTAAAPAQPANQGNPPAQPANPSNPVNPAG